MTYTNLLNRIWAALRDGSFAVKAAHRFSPVQYVPAEQYEIDLYTARHYPGDGKLLSAGARSVWAQFHPVFDKFEINNIAYVGANNGDLPLAVNEAFPGRELYLFEPVPDIFQILVERTRSLPNIHCFNLAVGAQETQSVIFKDSFSPASSLLRYDPLAIKEFPFLGQQTAAEVQIKPLDEVLEACQANCIDLLVMDVQGYEDEVLRGAGSTLETCKAVISELSLQDLYLCSATFDSVYQVLIGKGFRLRHILNPLRGESHQILQIDGVFVRDELAK